ncbi:MAG TPA: hypothetical protein PK358_00615 [Spirochaetota bacterium]|nr:hypothetical protein [Spirochaetota bacterium]HPJ33304.1 hypothetical protein [Spirochaetota bacterium]
MDISNLSDKPCIICGEMLYEWGYLRGDGLYFFDESSGFFKRNFSMKYQVRARRCRNCRNIQLFDIE